MKSVVSCESNLDILSVKPLVSGPGVARVYVLNVKQVTGAVSTDHCKWGVDPKQADSALLTLRPPTREVAMAGLSIKPRGRK